MEIIIESPAEKAFLNLLLAGFLSSNKKVREACTEALHCWGERTGGQDVIPALEHVASRTKSKSAKFRALLLKDRIATCPAASDVSLGDVLLMCLAASDPLLHEMAYHAASFLPEMVHDLISLAIGNLKKPQCCVRLLRAAGKTGQTPSSTEWFSLLMVLGQTKNQAVLEEAVKLMEGMQP